MATKDNKTLLAQYENSLKQLQASMKLTDIMYTNVEDKEYLPELFELKLIIQEEITRNELNIKRLKAELGV